MIAYIIIHECLFSNAFKRAFIFAQGVRESALWACFIELQLELDFYFPQEFELPI